MDDSTDKLAIEAVLDAVAQAHLARDAGAIVAAYEPDAMIFDLAPPLRHRGMQQAQVETWLQTWDGPIRIDRHDADLTIDGALAVQTAVIRMRGRQGGDDRDLWFRATSCLRRRAHRWRIAHEHTSVPFYMDGSDRAALDLEP